MSVRDAAVDFLSPIDWELLGTMAMVFSAEHVLEAIYIEFIPGGFWVEVIGWSFIFIAVTYLTAEEAEENEENDT